MAFAPPSKGKVTTNLAKSTWTPMNHPEANLQVFEERRELIKKWFQKWQDTQKRIIVDDVLKNLSTKHLVSLNEKLNGQFPQEKHDFTRILPRVLTLYLFSFLDPRTLCRCAQVSWYWNYLTEMDCLWRPKCLKFGWYPTYQPSPFEEKIWKRFYVNTVHELNFVKAKAIESKTPRIEERTPRPDTARSTVSRASVARSTSSSVSGLKKGPSVPSTKKPLSGPKWEPPPWKGSDPHPIDTMRYNYLDNMSRGKKKSSGLPDRPLSKHGRRPNSVSEKSRRYKHDGESQEGGDKKNFTLGLDKTTRLSEDVLAGYSTSGKLPSPRLNRDFKLPHYNGQDINASTRLDSTMPPAQYGNEYSTITSQISWQPQDESRNSLQQTVERPSSSYTRRQSNNQEKGGYSPPDITRLSVDAGVRPQPVAKFPSEKKGASNKAAEPVDRKVRKATSEKSHPTSNTEELQGQGWKAPTHSNSDEDF